MSFDDLPDDLPSYASTKLQGCPFQRTISLRHCFNASLASRTVRKLQYADFLVYACSQWGLKCSPDDLALTYYSFYDETPSDGKRVPTLITSPLEWSIFWTKWTENKQRRDRATPLLEIIPRPSIPNVFVGVSGSDGQKTSTTAAEVSDKGKQQATPPAQEATPAAAAVAPEANTQALVPEFTTQVPPPETTPRAAASSSGDAGQRAASTTAQIPDASSFLQRLTRDLSHAHDSYTKAADAMRETMGAARNAATPVNRGEGMFSTGEAAAHRVFDLLEGFVEKMNTAAQSAAQTSAAPRTTNQRPTPSSSYDNAPPSQPLRETPVPEDHVAPAPAAPHNAAAQAAQDTVKASPSPAARTTVSDKGKGRELPDKVVGSPVRSTPSSSGSPSASDDWEQLGKPTGGGVPADEKAESQAAIAANNVALEDAFQAMLQRLRQE